MRIHHGLRGMFFTLLLATLSCGGNGQPADDPSGGGAGGDGGTTTSSSGGGVGGSSSGSGGTTGCDGTPGGAVALSGVGNVRHTGGLPTSGGSCVKDNVLIRAGHLADLDSSGCAQLEGLQVKTVIDMRAFSGSTGAGANPDADCVTTGTDYYNADVIKLLPPTALSYLQTLAATEPELADIYGHLGKDDGLPAIIHCVIGRDRASLMMALVLLSVGVPAADVVSDFVHNQETTVEAAWLQAVVDQIESEGGIDAYLQQHGVTTGQIAKLKELALE
ncbi:MAG: tyrosine-protein phosphatase [Deltaproteobacteria bacterium]|nr:tyrosine-protein phosphatase [Deltaproteobacteria bacterium]